MKKNLHTLDKLVSKGNFIEAIELFFDENAVTKAENGSQTTSKNEKLAAINRFLNEIKSIEKIKLHDSFVDASTSYSAFSFHFLTNRNRLLIWNEVIERVWENKLVVEENYLNVDFKELKKSLKNKKSEIADVKESSLIQEEIIPNDLTEIIGIGPKIQEILNKNGIYTFKQLSDWKPDDLSSILSAEGKRFQLHDTSTWADQASQLM